MSVVEVGWAVLGVAWVLVAFWAALTVCGRL